MESPIFFGDKCAQLQQVLSVLNNPRKSSEPPTWTLNCNDGNITLKVCWTYPEFVLNCNGLQRELELPAPVTPSSSSCLPLKRTSRKRKSPATLKRDKFRRAKWLATKNFLTPRKHPHNQDTLTFQNGIPAEMNKVIAIHKEPISKRDLDQEHNKSTDDKNEHVATRIIQSTLFGQKIYYQIQWTDGTCSWESKLCVPKTLLKTFYVNKARKLKNIKNNGYKLFVK